VDTGYVNLEMFKMLYQVLGGNVELTVNGDSSPNFSFNIKRMNPFLTSSYEREVYMLVPIGD
jgi:hypothetical protein